MKNALFLFVLSFRFIGASNLSYGQSKESLKRQQFVSEFIEAVNVKKKNRIIKCIDRNNVSKYLDGIHKGNKDEFLSDFFKGLALTTNEYSRIPLDKIFDIRLSELNELQEGIAECKIILKTPEDNILTVLYLKSLKKKGKFAFVPAQR
jgi:hypothetical protein